MTATKPSPPNIDAALVRRLIGSQFPIHLWVHGDMAMGNLTLWKGLIVAAGLSKTNAAEWKDPRRVIAETLGIENP